MEKKVTKKEMYGEIVRLAQEMEREDIVIFANHEIELLERKANRSTQTKTQVENENIKNDILVALEELGRAVTISELQKVETMENYSNQKLSALLRQLVESDQVVKIIDKKKSFFSIK